MYSIILRGLFLFPFLALGPASAIGEQPTPRYLWPLKEEACLTSSFGEHREGHLHAGIDISTGRTEGREVVAVAAGEVYRVKTRVRGLGKALYLLLSDGRLAVYGHLSRFSDPIERYVRAEQIERRKYVVDLYPAPGSFPVKEGEIIAWSGQTGSGPPHLHFEIRENEMVPVNPLRAGIVFADTTAPVPKAVAIEPLDRTSRVDGSPFPVVVPVEWSAVESSYVFARVPRCIGRMGIAVSVADRNPGCSGVLAPYEVELLVEEESRLVISLGSANFHLGYQADAIYGPELGGGRSPFLRLHLLPGVNLPIYGGETAGAEIGPTTGGSQGSSVAEQDIRIIVKDAAENEAVIRGRLSFEIPSSPEDPRRDPSEDLPDEAAPPRLHTRVEWGRDFLALMVKVEGRLAAPPRALLRRSDSSPGRSASGGLAESPAADQWCRLDRVGDGDYLRCFHPSTAGRPGTLSVEARGISGEVVRTDIPIEPSWLVTREEGGRIGFAEEVVRLSISPDGLFRDTAVRIYPEDLPPLPPGVEAVTGAYRLEPQDTPFAVRPWLELWPGDSLDAEDASAVGLYRLEEDGGPIYLGSVVEEEDQYLGARVSGLFTVALLRDEEPPRILSLQVKQPPGRAEGAAGPRILARIREVGSGLEPEGVVMLMDDDWVPAAWDPERDLVSYQHPEPLAAGSHRIRLSLTDRAGNTVARSRDFRVR